MCGEEEKEKKSDDKGARPGRGEASEASGVGSGSRTKRLKNRQKNPWKVTRRRVICTGRWGALSDEDPGQDPCRHTAIYY